MPVTLDRITIVSCQALSEDPDLAAQIEAVLAADESNRQIDWHGMYNVNRNPGNITTIRNIYGTNDSITGNLSRYVIEDRRYDSKRFSLATTYSDVFNRHVTLYSGFSYEFQNKHNHKRLEDLLGGDFYIDINEFAERDFPDDIDKAQNDLNNPNNILYEGDIMGYDYHAVIQKGTLWGTGLFSFNNVDITVGGDVRYTSYYRDGKMRNGQFPDNSFGKSAVQNFVDYGVKAGLLYKANGRNYLFANGLYMTKAPLFRNAYVSPRTRDQIADTVLTSETIRSIEAGYYYRSPRVKIAVVGYYTEFLDQIRTWSFYHDEIRNFVNYTLTGIDKRHLGLEISARVQLHPTFAISAAAGIGQYIWTSRPQGTITLDNNADVLQKETIYAKGFHEGGRPEMAYTFGLNYSSPKYWFASLNFNYVDNIWASFNPARRTTLAIENVNPNSEIWDDILEQEKFDGAFSMNFFGGYSWKLDKTFKGMKKPMYLAIYLGVNNITNNRNARSNGYEQLRFDFEGKDVNRFPNKYYYALGTNYFLQAVLRFD